MRRAFWLTIVMVTLVPAVARAEVVERVVAIVDGRAILASEVERERVRSHVGAREALDALIDAQLVERQAALEHVTITHEESDAFVARVTGSTSWTRLLADESGEAGARARVEHMLLDSKMFQRRWPHLEPSAEDREAAYRKVSHDPVEQPTLMELVSLLDDDAGVNEALLQTFVTSARAGAWLQDLRDRAHIESRL